MKKSFSILEVILLLAVISIILSQSQIKLQQSNLDDAVKKIKLHLNYTRYIAHIDNKEDIEDDEWMKKLWTLKFQNCSQDVGGLYYVIYSDKSGGTAHFKKEETLKEPLTNKYLYSNSDCEVSSDESGDVLISKKYGITKVEISCNSTSTIGQISFGYDGNVYSKLGSSPKQITDPCYIKLYDKENRSSTITIQANTGYIY